MICLFDSSKLFWKKLFFTLSTQVFYVRTQCFIIMCCVEHVFYQRNLFHVHIANVQTNKPFIKTKSKSFALILKTVYLPWLRTRVNVKATTPLSGKIIFEVRDLVNFLKHIFEERILESKVLTDNLNTFLKWSKENR